MRTVSLVLVGSVALLGCAKDEGDDAEQVASTEQAVTTASGLSRIAVDLGRFAVAGIGRPGFRSKLGLAARAKAGAGCPEVTFSASCSGLNNAPPCTVDASADYGTQGCNDPNTQIFHTGKISVHAEATGDQVGDTGSVAVTLDHFLGDDGNVGTGTIGGSVTRTAAGFDAALDISIDGTNADGLDFSVDLGETAQVDLRGTPDDPSDDRALIDGTASLSNELGAALDLSIDGLILDGQLCSDRPAGGVVHVSAVDPARGSFTATVEFNDQCSSSVTIQASGPAQP